MPDEQGQGSREQAAESRRPQERAGELLERRLQRRRAHRDVPAQAQPPARSRTTLPSFDGLGVSLDDADAIVKMRQVHPAQYARSPEAVHTRELAALHEELSSQAGGQRAGAEVLDGSRTSPPGKPSSGLQPAYAEEEQAVQRAREEWQRMRPAGGEVEAPQAAAAEETDEEQTAMEEQTATEQQPLPSKEEWLLTHQAGEAKAPQAAAEDADAVQPSLWQRIQGWQRMDGEVNALQADVEDDLSVARRKSFEERRKQIKTLERTPNMAKSELGPPADAPMSKESRAAPVEPPTGGTPPQRLHDRLAEAKAGEILSQKMRELVSQAAGEQQVARGHAEELAKAKADEIIVQKMLAPTLGAQPERGVQPASAWNKHVEFETQHELETPPSPRGPALQTSQQRKQRRAMQASAAKSRHHRVEMMRKQPPLGEVEGGAASPALASAGVVQNSEGGGPSPLSRGLDVALPVPAVPAVPAVPVPPAAHSLRSVRVARSATAAPADLQPQLLTPLSKDEWLRMRSDEAAEELVEHVEAEHAVAAAAPEVSLPPLSKEEWQRMHEAEGDDEAPQPAATSLEQRPGGQQADESPAARPLANDGPRNAKRQGDHRRTEHDVRSMREVTKGEKMAFALYRFQSFNTSSTDGLDKHVFCGLLAATNPSAVTAGIASSVCDLCRSTLSFPAFCAASSAKTGWQRARIVCAETELTAEPSQGGEPGQGTRPSGEALEAFASTFEVKNRLRQRECAHRSVAADADGLQACQLVHTFQSAVHMLSVIEHVAKLSMTQPLSKAVFGDMTVVSFEGVPECERNHTANGHGDSPHREHLAAMMGGTAGTACGLYHAYVNAGGYLKDLEAACISAPTVSALSERAPQPAEGVPAPPLMPPSPPPMPPPCLEPPCPESPLQTDAAAMPANRGRCLYSDSTPLPSRDLFNSQWDWEPLDGMLFSQCFQACLERPWCQSYSFYDSRGTQKCRLHSEPSARASQKAEWFCGSVPRPVPALTTEAQPPPTEAPTNTPIEAPATAPAPTASCLREHWTDMNGWYASYDPPRAARASDCQFACERGEAKSWCVAHEFSFEDNGSCKLFAAPQVQEHKNMNDWYAKYDPPRAAMASDCKFICDHAWWAKSWCAARR